MLGLGVSVLMTSVADTLLNSQQQSQQIGSMDTKSRWIFFVRYSNYIRQSRDVRTFPPKRFKNRASLHWYRSIYVLYSVLGRADTTTTDPQNLFQPK